VQVRDRATLYLAELDGLAGGPEAIDVHWTIPAKNLEKSLREYLENGTDAPFDLVSICAVQLAFMCEHSKQSQGIAFFADHVFCKAASVSSLIKWCAAQESVPRALPQAPQKDQKNKAGPAAPSKPVSIQLCPKLCSLKGPPYHHHDGM
jgi:hypothetical protein